MPFNIFGRNFFKESGVEFDRSRKDEPFSFTIGSSQVIELDCKFQFGVILYIDHILRYGFDLHSVEIRCIR